MRRNWLSAYDFVTARGDQFLSGYARTADPFARIGERTMSVQVTSVIRASERSFQVKWTETTYERGSETDSSHWTAILTVISKPPVTADTLLKNPLGIYIDAIDWSRELEPSAPTAPTRINVPSNTVPLGSPLDPDLSVQSTVNMETVP